MAAASAAQSSAVSQSAGTAGRSVGGGALPFAASTARRTSAVQPRTSAAYSSVPGTITVQPRRVVRPAASVASTWIAAALVEPVRVEVPLVAQGGALRRAGLVGEHVLLLPVDEDPHLLYPVARGGGVEPQPEQVADGGMDARLAQLARHGERRAGTGMVTRMRARQPPVFLVVVGRLGAAGRRHHRPPVAVAELRALAAGAGGACHARDAAAAGVGDRERRDRLLRPWHGVVIECPDNGQAPRHAGHAAGRSVFIERCVLAGPDPTVPSACRLWRWCTRSDSGSRGGRSRSADPR